MRLIHGEPGGEAVQDLLPFDTSESSYKGVVLFSMLPRFHQISVSIWTVRATYDKAAVCRTGQVG